MPAKSIIDTLNSWKAVIAVIVTISTGGWVLRGYHTRLTAVEGAVIDLGSAIVDDRYTKTQAAERALRTAIENPGMRVPDPRDPSHIIVVEVGHIKP